MPTPPRKVAAVQEWDLLPELRIWLGTEEKEELLLSALRQAIALLSGLTGLSPLPEALVPAAVELAAVRLNRRGREGESIRREGSLSVTFGGLSPETARLVRSYLAAKAGYADAP